MCWAAGTLAHQHIHRPALCFRCQHSLHGRVEPLVLQVVVVQDLKKRVTPVKS